MSADLAELFTRTFTSREEAIRFVADLCVLVGREHDWNVNTLQCTRCGLSAEMLDEINA